VVLTALSGKIMLLSNGSIVRITDESKIGHSGLFSFLIVAVEFGTRTRVRSSSRPVGESLLSRVATFSVRGKTVYNTIAKMGITAIFTYCLLLRRFIWLLSSPPRMIEYNLELEVETTRAA
jgi:hypothetical protein